MSDPKPLWQPSEYRSRTSLMTEFMHRIAVRYGVPMEWEPLRRWSIERPDLFWGEMFEFAEIQPSEVPHSICSGAGMLGTKWFEGCRLNYARHMLRFDDHKPAIIFETERGSPSTISHRELRDAVARCAAALRNEGVAKGDRVAGYLPNLPETVIAMLAAVSIGAIWSSCSPDFGVQGVLDRFKQIEPVILVASAGYSYGGKRFDILPRIAEILPQLPSVRRVVIVAYPNDQPDETLAASVDHLIGPRARFWEHFVGPPYREAPQLGFEQVAFDHPLFIMYSSGTTGIPKCIIHGHGGTLLQHAKEHMLHTDLRRGERLFYFTTCGWMMWNWLVSGLGVGATIVLYEGNPAYPDIGHLWDMAARLEVDVFGTSPKFIAACEKADIHPGRDYDLSAIRCLLSTGSPLAAEQFDWIYKRLSPGSDESIDLQIASICGGTDIISCFMLGNPVLPVYAGEIQCRGLGMDVHAFDADGLPVIGEKGELVCTSPFPSQPVGFWNDPDGKKYRSAYFDHPWRAPSPSKLPPPSRTHESLGAASTNGPSDPIWRHGDFIEITPRGGIIVYGRSDATLNPGGVRIGTAEIYRLVESIPEIVDSIVVGRKTDNDEEIALFVVLRQGSTLTDGSLAEKIRRTIGDGATKRHVPRFIHQVADIPRTISGKKVELAVQQILHGEEVRNRDALANPAALDEFAQFR